MDNARARWRYDDADWENFSQIITQHIEAQPSIDITEFLHVIHEAATNTIPRTSSKVGRKSLHWWSADTKRAVKIRRKALRAAKRLPESHPDKAAAMEAYRTKRNECRQIIRDAKKKDLGRIPR